MKILLTGASSFTGTWFAKALREAGHEVVATLRAGAAEYSGLRGERIRLLRDLGVIFLEQCSFGDDSFINQLHDGVEIVCHHAAQVSNYKSLDFDVLGAVRDNTLNVRSVLNAGREAGVKAFVVTGSVFEQDEGLGNAPLRAFSPYGLSKGLTWKTFEYWSEQLAVPVHKFVIPNPFGPMEEPRFCAHLLQKWSRGEVAQVGTPAYIRDNIHVSLLAAAYRDFVRRGAQSTISLKSGPSGYVESQGAFARRFAREIGDRLSVRAELDFVNQTDFPEPRMRINADRLDSAALGWSEASAWDGLAAYYRATYLG